MAAIIKFIMISCVLFCVSCKKPTHEQPAEELVTTEMKQGLPENPKLINGYLYAGYTFDVNTNYYSRALFSTFSDPAKNLLAGYNHSLDQVPNFTKTGNIDVGQLNFNGFNVNRNSTSTNLFYFNSFSNLNYMNIAFWGFEGNGSFKPYQDSVTRGFPVVLNTFSTSVISKSGFTLTVTNLASNYDSLELVINRNSSNMIRKTVAAGVNTISFTASEMYFLSATNYGLLNLQAYNYSHKTVQNKLYVFELAKKVPRSVTITP